MHLKSIGCEPKSNIMYPLRREVYIRVYHAERKICMGSRVARRTQRAKRKANSDTAISYLAGGFGLSKEPDGICRKSKKKKNADETEVAF